MVFDKKPLQIRMTTENKEICQKIGADVLRSVLELNIKNCYSSDNINIAILEDDIKQLKDKRNKLLEDIHYYNVQIEKSQNRVNTLSNLIEVKNKELREHIDIMSHQKQEKEQMFHQIQDLIKENKLNEISVNEILENRQYMELNQLVTSIIIEFKKIGADTEIINILENCKIVVY